VLEVGDRTVSVRKTCSNAGHRDMPPCSTMASSKKVALFPDDPMLDRKFDMMPMGEYMG